MHATGTFDGKTWDEKPWDEREDLPKLTRASLTNSFLGDVEGEGTLEYLMAYREDGSADFVGLERVVGRIGDRAGSFVLRHTGVFEGGAAKCTWSVVPGSGSGELRGLTGSGGFVAEHAQSVPYTLDYDFE